MSDEDEAHEQPANEPLDRMVLASEVVAQANLVVMSGRAASHVFPLSDPNTVIGRSPKAQVRIDDKSISSRHARIVQQGGRHFLIDLGSMNGTFLNGQRLTSEQPVALTFGDSVQVADIVLAYVQAHGAGDDHTQYLSKLVPQFPGSTALRMPDAGTLAQMLQARSLAPAAAEAEGPSLEEQIAKLMKILAVVRRNWIPLVVGISLCGLVGNLTVFFAPPPSEATFRLRITPPQLDEKTRDIEGAQQQFFTIAEQDYQSTSVIERTLENLGELHPKAGRIDSLREELKFTAKEYMTYVGSFKHRDAHFAVTVLKAQLESYLAYELRRTLHVVQAEADFLTERVKEREIELRKTEEELRAFKTQNLEGLPENTTGRMDSRENLLTKRAALGAPLSKTNLELQAARKRLEQEAPALSKKVDSALPYEQSMGEAKRKLAEARAKGLGEQHPDVVALNKQIADLQRLADVARHTESTDVERAANPKLLELRNRVADLEVASKGAGAELGAVSGLLGRLDSIVKTMPDVEAKYAQLTRSYTVNKEMYSQLFEQLRASQLKLELERTSAKARYEVIAPPSSDGVPIRKALLMRTGIGAAIGLALGVLVAAILELKRLLRARAARKTTALAIHQG
jgi:uncharacterized protein involved in exopolysaccharide biosynthesis